MTLQAVGRTHRLKLAVVGITAAAAVGLAAYFYYYLTHIPVAREPRAEETLKASVDRELLLDGLAAGPVITMNFRHAERVELTFARGAELVDPPAGQLAGYPAPPGGYSSLPETRGRRHVTILPRGGSAQIKLSVEGDRPGLLFAPEPSAGAQTGFRVRPRRGTLRVLAEMSEADNPEEAGEMIYADGRTARQVDHVELTVSPDAQLAVAVLGMGARAGRSDAGEEAVPLVITLPTMVENAPDQPRLVVGAVAVGLSDGERFAVDRIACAAEPGHTMLWRSPFPRIDVDRCAPRGLQVAQFNPLAATDQVHLVAGWAFHVGENGPEYWTGPSTILGNSFISAAFGALVASLIGWAGFSIKRGIGGNSSQPDKFAQPAAQRKRRRPRKRGP